MRRPAGITILCLVLAWLTLAGIGNAYLILTRQFADLPMYLGFFAAGYAVAALLTTLGLWQMKMWGV
jgi:hypothetical protein